MHEGLVCCRGLKNRIIILCFSETFCDPCCCPGLNSAQNGSGLVCNPGAMYGKQMDLWRQVPSRYVMQVCGQGRFLPLI